MKIRPSQISEFERADAPHVAPRLARHAREAFPKHCGYLGEEGVEEAVQYAFKEGASHNLTLASSIQLFLDLMFLLGRGFDHDVQLPWAVQILSDSSIGDEMVRMRTLHAKAIEYLDKVSGPNNEFIDAAQVRIGQESPGISRSGAEFENDMIQRLWRVFPEKCTYLCEDILKQVIQRGIALARQYELKQARAVVVLTGLTFMLGSHFDTDPQFASINQALNESAGESGARADRLYQAAIEYLKQWCG
jgi:hypothetical protein